MIKINFYKIGHSIDHSVIGNVPVDLNRQISEFIDPENTDVERMNLYQKFRSNYHPNTIDFTKFKTNDNAKITDLMSSLFLPKSFFISLKFHEIIKQFKISNVKFFNANFRHKEEKYNYKVLNYKETTDLIILNHLFT